MRPRVLALFLTVVGALHAQRYNFKFYAEEQGLQNLAVQVVMQDRAGFLWAGTQNGLYRYDGNHFIAFSKAEGLPGARIESLHESIDGTLWVGTRTGLARRDGDRFEVVPLRIAEGVIGREGIASDQGGRLYLATEQGLVTGTPNSSGMQFALTTRPTLVDKAEAASVYVDPSGGVWYGCGNSLCRYEQGQGREIGSEEGLPFEKWDAILEDLEGNLWVRSDRSLFVRAAGARRFQPRGGLPEATNTYPTLALDPLGRLLVTTYRGVARPNGSGWELIGAQEGLTTNDISSVVQDREGSLWLGLLGSGLARWLGYHEWQSWNDSDGLSRESIWSIARDSRGRLWVGTQFGLNYAEQRGGKLLWRQQPVAGVNMIRALAAAPDGTLWIGGAPGGLRQLNPGTGQSYDIGAKQGLNSNDVLHVSLDGEGRLWAATRNGLFRSRARVNWDLEPDFEQQFPADTQPGETFRMTIADRQGNVWAAGDRGLARFAQGHWIRFTMRDGLKSDMIFQMAADQDGSLWIAYRDAYGITHFTQTNDGFKTEHFTVANGLHSDKAVFLGFDKRGWLWIGTDHGADVFDRVRWRHFGRPEGLIWDDCNNNAFLADMDGSLWIGTSRGLSRYQPSASLTPNVPPPVVFTSAKFGDRTIDLERNPGSDIDVPYSENSLQVRFAALTFVQEPSVVFRYRLTGASGWVETTQRELNYPKLPPGQYTLEVMARNAQGQWSAEPARLNFQILTPWWLTWWFRVASVLVALLMGHLMWQRRTHRLQAERHRLETAVTQRTRELSLEKQRVIEEKRRTEQQKHEIERLFKEAQQASRFKSEFLANMSHEIRTPMNGILGMTDLVLATPLTEEQREYLDTARLSANSLLALLNSILDFSKIEAGRLDLNPIEFEVRQCVQETAKMLAFPAAERRLSLNIRVAAEVPDRVVGDPHWLRQVLLNLLGNAIKFTEEGSVELTVSGRPPDGADVALHFAVRDTGIGIPAEKQELIFEAFRQADGSTTRKYGGTGLGLAICSRLVGMMGGALRVESEAGRGSTFHFTAKFGAVKPADSQEAGEADLPAPDPPGSLNVLLAEDNIVNQRLVVRLLAKRGHRVVLAASGREALERFDRERFDLILMDVQMPDMDGLEATAVIREREKKTGSYTPIVALTADAVDGDRKRCLAAGMDHYINKPIEAAKLLELVETITVARPM
jgi:signal transduction histidine kinase/ligand-binding sensor domain-containing protein/CheY-like chemotaxis protein